MKTEHVAHPTYPFEASASVCPPPVFDVSRAKQARCDASELVSKETGYTPFPAAEMAVSLLLYNHNLTLDTLPKTPIQTTVGRIVQQEVHEAKPQSPLPTIGIEIEAGLTSYTSQTDKKNLPYEAFFKALHMPENDSSDIDDYWEFTPPPAYAAATTSRIIAELIAGRFIPSLRPNNGQVNRVRFSLTKDEQEKIHTQIFSKLISLHINLVLPPSLDNSEYENTYDEDDLKGEANLLAGSLAIAYASQQRLEKRENDILTDIHNDAVKTAKSTNTTRLEMLPFEVGAASTYQLLAASQYLGAAFLEAYQNEDTYLANCWHSFSKNLSLLLPFDPMTNPYDIQDRLVELRADTELRSAVRSLIHIFSNTAKQIIALNNQQ